MFNTTLRELRNYKGITQAELAKHLDVTQQAVGRWEKAITSPDYETLKKIAAYFNVTTDYLLGLSDHPHGEPFAGQSGKNFLDFADQPPAPAGQSGKQSTGGTEGEMEEGGTILMRAQNELDPDELQQLENMAEYFLNKKLKNK